MRIPKRQEQLDALTRKYLREPKADENGQRHDPHTGVLSDEEIVAKLRGAKNAAKFSDLNDAGDTSAYDDDESRADLALMGMYAFYTQDQAQLERLFGDSALGQRPKWRNRPDYRRRTIGKAISLVTETYHPRGRQPKAESTRDSEANFAGDKPTDDELRDRFIERCPEYSYGLGRWRHYGGGIWEATDELGVRDEVCRILEEAKAEKIRPNRALVLSVFELAKARVAAADEKWDADPDILVCANGALRLSTRELEPHSRDHYATTRVPYDYDPDAASGVWEQRVMGELIAQNLGVGAVHFLQEFAGYCLTVDTSHEIALWLHGRHGGGRSTILEGLRAMLGSRAGLLSLSDIERSSFALTNLPGRTLVTATEQPGTFIRGGGVLNAIISGEPIQVDLKFRDPLEITPRCKIAWAMNELPRVGSPDDGLFRRVKILSIPEIPEKDRDPAVKEEVKVSGAAILNWALDGLERLRVRGHFEVPEEVKTATDEFKEDNDVVASFLEAECEIGEDYSVRATPLYRAYDWWCDRHGHKPLNETNLGRDLRNRGFEKARDSQGVKRLGLRLRSNDYSPY